MHKHRHHYTKSQFARNIPHCSDSSKQKTPLLNARVRTAALQLQTEIRGVNIVTPRYLVDIRFGKRFTKTVD